MREDDEESMRKLISNKAAKTIREKHTQEEIDNGILMLSKVGNEIDMQHLLEQKLLEEVNEILFTHNMDGFRNELDDLIEVCKALQGKSKKFDQGYVLENTK